MRCVLTRERSAAVLADVKQGIDLAVAEANAGLGKGVVDEWLERGSQSTAGKYAQFFDRLADAQGRGGFLRTPAARRLRIPLKYSPHEAGTKFHIAQRRITCACAGRRGGKTQAGAAEFSVRIVRDLGDKLAGRARWEGQPHLPWEPGAGKAVEPFLRYAVVAPVYALLDEPRKALQREFGLAQDGGLIVSQTDHVWWLAGGIRIDFLSGDRPERLVGMGYDGIWFEEGARLKAKVWTDNMRPTLSDKQGWALWTTTPLGKNWFWEEVWTHGDRRGAEELATMRGCKAEEILDPEYAAVAWTTADNTKLPHLVEEMAIAKRQMPPALYSRNYEANFDAFEGQCFDFIAALHSRQVLAERATTLSVGFDLGDNHPAAFSIVGVVDGVVREIWSESASRTDNYGDDAWKRRVVGDRATWANRIWAALYNIVGDGWGRVQVHVPTDGADVKRAWGRYGFATRPAYQEHQPALDWMQIALHNTLFTCSSTIVARQLTALRYPGQGESSRKLWLDKDDDVWDALRYALTPWISRVRHGELPMPTALPGLGWR